MTFKASAHDEGSHEGTFAIGGEVRPGLVRRAKANVSASGIFSPPPASLALECSYVDDDWSMVNFANPRQALEGGAAPLPISQGALASSGQPDSMTGVTFACAILEKAILENSEDPTGSKEVQSAKKCLLHKTLAQPCVDRISCLKVCPDMASKIPEFFLCKGVTVTAADSNCCK